VFWKTDSNITPLVLYLLVAYVFVTIDGGWEAERSYSGWQSDQGGNTWNWK